MNFCISSMGRSGTKFLSRVLNQSKTFLVRHEPQSNGKTKGLIYRDRFHFVQERFDRIPNYGEVNSFLRLILEDLRVDRKAIITRDPRDIHLSSYNKRKGVLDKEYYEQIQKAFQVLDRYLQNGIPRIRFELMISDPDYLLAIANYVGISDVKYTIATCRKVVNAKPYKLVKTFDEMPSEHRERGLEAFYPYLQKYYIQNESVNELGV